MKFSRKYIIATLVLFLLYLVFFRHQTSGFWPFKSASVCVGTCTGWKSVSNSSTYACPSDKPNKKVGLGGQQVNCCKCP